MPRKKAATSSKEPVKKMPDTNADDNVKRLRSGKKRIASTEKSPPKEIPKVVKCKRDRSNAHSTKRKANLPKPTLNNTLENFDDALKKYNEIKTVRPLQINLNIKTKTSNKRTKNQSPAAKRLKNILESQRKHEKELHIPNKKSRISNDSYYEEMDWDSIVSEVNQHIESRNITSFSGEKLNEIKNSDCTYIVVDTNIFLSHLETISNVVNPNRVDLNIIVAVPWRVIRELDGLKKDEKFNYIGRKVLNFLHKNLKSNCRITGQSLEDANSHIYPCHTADDEVLNCCLQYSFDKRKVVLLSNDKNLCTKAIINSIIAYNHDEFLCEMEGSSKISENVPIVIPNRAPTPPENSNPDNLLLKIHENIQESIKKFLSNILEREMKLRYEDMWLQIVLHKPPWNVNSILECILKHWYAVFGEMLPKNAQNVIKDVKYFFPKRRAVTLSNTEDLKAAASACMQLVKFFQVHDAYMASSHQCTKEIKMLLNQILREKENNNKSESNNMPVSSPMNETSTISSTVYNPSVSTDHIVSEVLLFIWNGFTSYCYQLANALGVPHNLSVDTQTPIPIQTLIDQADSVKNQVDLLIACLSSILINYPVQENSAPYKKIKANVASQELFNCLNASVIGLGQSGLKFTVSDLQLYCNNHREVIEDGHNKFMMLNNLLLQCSVQYSNIKMQP